MVRGIWERIVLSVSATVIFSLIMSIIVCVGLGEGASDSLWSNVFSFVFVFFVYLSCSIPSFILVGIVGSVFIQKVMDKGKIQKRKMKYIISLVCYALMGAVIAQIYNMELSLLIDSRIMTLNGIIASLLYFHLSWHREYIFETLS